MLKTILVAATAGIGLMVFDASQSMAGVDIDVGIGGQYRISCRRGANIVANAGFRRVRPIECSGREYTYRGSRRDSIFSITVKSRNGRIVSIDRIRRSGGYGDGGYGEEEDDGGDEY